MKKRSKKSELIHVKNVLNGLLRNCRKESDTDLGEIRQIWNAILDKSVIENAQPAALKDGILLVKIKSPTLTHQLRFQLSDIIENINIAMSDARITEIKLTIGNF